MAKKTKTKIPLIIAATIVIIIIVIVLVVFLGAKKEEGESETEKPAIAEEIYGFSAVIKEINNKTLTLEGWVHLADTETGAAKVTARGVVTDNTKIVKWEFPENLPKEAGKRVSAKETPISFDTLKVGDKIDIGAFNNISENIKNNTEFNLKHIFIIEK